MTAPVDDVSSIGGPRRVPIGPDGVDADGRPTYGGRRKWQPARDDDTPTPPAPTLAPVAASAEADRLRLALSYFHKWCDYDFGPAENDVAELAEAARLALTTIDESIRAARMEGYAAAEFGRLLPPARPLPAAPMAVAFVEAAVDALDKAAYAVAAWDAGGPSALGDPTHRRHAARAALIAAHAAAVEAALQSGWHAGLDEGRSQRDAMATIDTSTWTEADPPALVNGGPAVDGLDES